MSISAIVLRGYSNGTFSGTVPLVVTRGYSIAEITTIFGHKLYLSKENNVLRLSKENNTAMLSKENNTLRLSK